jgi:uncharacterized membrane protein YhaH (DUF805 family)
MNWFSECFKKYATFAGRARRTEYWTFHLIYTLIIIAAAVLISIIGISAHDTEGGRFAVVIISALVAIFALACLLPSLAVSIRRLHDTGRSGGWWFINFVPIIGPLVFLVFMFLGSEPGENLYGPNPKQEA